MRFGRPGLALLVFLLPACGTSGKYLEDGGVPAAPTAVDAEIQALRDAPLGAVRLPVGQALVTFVTPDGFFIQGSRTGPAILVEIVAPSPEVGDRVSFTATGIAAESLMRRVTAIEDDARASTGAVPEAQVVSNSGDLVSSLDAYESELVQVEATIVGGFTSDDGFVEARIETGGIRGTSQLVLRAPAALVDSLPLQPGTRFLATTPLTRSGATAQVSIWTSADVTVLAAPTLRVESAAAATATSVVVTFSRRLDPSSLRSDGSQFTFTNGLRALAATASDRTATVTTSIQVLSAPYRVTVAGTVRDQFGNGIDPAAASASFIGF